MAYSDLANNQGVSFNSLISGVSQGYFSAKTTIPSTNKMATKAACNTYVTVNPLYPPFASKANDQLVVKQDLQNSIGTISISNNFFAGTITDVTVNGVSITGASFPLDIGNGTTGYTTQVGTYNILVYYADATNPDNYMRITDSEYNNSCVDGFSSSGPGPYYVTFSSQIINTSVAVDIISGDGGCTAPPPTLIEDLPFSTVAVSRGTGQYMIAGNANIGNPFIEGALFRSTNYGVTWTLQGQFGYWNKVAISDNGQYMLAVEYYGRAYKSSDYGATWTAINNFPYPDTNPYGLPVLQTLNFRGAALSGDGEYQVISTSQTFYGRTISGDTTIDSFYTTIFVSDDYGATWSARKTDTAGTYNAVAISASGQTVLAAVGTLFVGQGSILRSTNYGVNWSGAANSFNAGNLVDVAITADGNYAIAARFSNDIIEFSAVPYLLSSSDGGASWYNATFGEAQKYWMRVAIYRVGDTFATAWALPNTTFPSSTTVYIYEVGIYLNYVTQWEDQPAAKFYKSIANSDDGLHILAGANNGLFRSNDGGFTWTAIQSTG
jgi:hypothetical protein